MRIAETKTFGYFTILLAATLLLIFLHLRGWLRPVESAAVQTTRPFVYVLSGTGNLTKSFFSLFASVNGLNRQNADLKQQVRTLQEQNVTLQQYKLENEVLKKELNYRSASGFDLVSADVIAKDPTGFTQTITLDVGDNQNVRVGDAVLAQGALVGKVTALDEFTCKVLLITDSQSKIDAELSSSGEKGVLQGSFGSGVVLTDISQDAVVNKDDQVATAGLTDQIPKGILIGTVGELQSQKNDLLQTVTITPAVDLKGLQFVAVVRR